MWYYLLSDESLWHYLCVRDKGITFNAPMTWKVALLMQQVYFQKGICPHVSSLTPSVLKEKQAALQQLYAYGGKCSIADCPVGLPVTFY